jgi:hypothetical protein
MAMANEEWLTFEDTTELVRAHLGASIGRAQAVTNEARASGEVRFQNLDYPVLLMADDGLVGMDMRPGAQEKSGVTVDGKAIIHKIQTGTFQISKNDLLDWLERNHPRATSAPPKQAGRGGRPPLVDWTVAKAQIFHLMDHHGEFSADDPEWNAQVRLEEAIQKFCVSKFGIEPATSTLRGHLGEALRDWRARRSET